MTEIKDGSNQTSEAKMPRNFSWVVEDRLAGMGYPDNESNIQYLINYNIKHIISLTESTALSIGSFPEIETLSLKVKDFTPPTIDQIQQCLSFIEKCHKDENAVVVHCAHGKGRTGTILACYLVKMFDMDPEAAIAKLREMRPGSVETLEQECMVKTFAEIICQKKDV